MITVENAIVFRAPGRRFLTLRAAARYAARQKIVARNIERGGERGDIDTQAFHSQVRRLAYIYMKHFRNTPKPG